MSSDVIEVVILAKDNASKAIGGIRSAIGGLGSALAPVGALAGGALAAGVGAVAAIGAGALSAAVDTRNAAFDMQAQFGMTAGEAERTAQLARDAWANNWGASVGDVSGVMGSVIQQLGDFGVVSDEAITGATTDALALRDVFGVETPASIDAARALMERFGVDSETAFNIITTGMQSGLSANGDFMESITEYAPVFEAAGFSAEQMYSIMESGAASGVLGTDKISDAVKEMNIKLTEGGDATRAAFSSMGMDFNEIAGFVASGDETWADYFDDIVAGINSIEDPIERQKAQVAIFGTMAEDLGVNFTEGLTSAGAAIGDFEGATDSLNAKYQDFGSLWEGVKRQVIDALSPVADFVLGLANDHLPAVQEVIGKISGFIGNFISRMQNGTPLLSNLTSFVMQISGLFGMSNEEAMKFGGTVNLIVNSYLGPFIQRMKEIVTPIWDAITNFISFKDVLIGLGIAILSFVLPIVAGLIGSLITFLAPILAVIGVVALLRTAWENNWGGIRDKVAEVWGAIQPVLQMVWDWLSVNIPAGLEALRAFWVDNVWPAIQGAIEFVWPIIQAIFSTLVHIVQTVVIPMIQELYRWWVDTAWPAISEALQTAWEDVIKPALYELRDFVIDTLLPAIQELATKWTEEIWPAIKTAISEAWENVIKPAFEAINTFAKETIPNAIGKMRDKFNEITGNIRSAIQPMKDLWDQFVDAVISFWEWLTGKDFSIQIDVPQTPSFTGDRVSPAPGVKQRGALPDLDIKERGGGSTTVINIDARGAAKGVDRDLRAMVEQVLREHSVRADVRLRTT
jgi:phage-related minor tail protein